MTAPSPPKIKAAELSSPTSSPEIPKAQPRTYNRYADTAFGNRLANARNLSPTQAPPPPPPRSILADSTASMAAGTAVHHTIPPPGAPKHGWEKGSYRNPYDYNIPGHTVGSKITPTAQPHQPDPLPGLGAQSAAAAPRSATFSFGAMSSANTTEFPKEESIVTTPEVRVVTPPADAKERLLLLGPLRMIRHECATTADNGLALLAKFIDSYMADELHTIVERDAIIPGVVYKVSIPMTDENWEKYNKVLAVFDRATGLHGMLAVGQAGFDQYSPSPALGPYQREGFRVLAAGALAGMGLEEILEETVQEYRWDWMNHGAGYVGHGED